MEAGWQAAGIEYPLLATVGGGSHEPLEGFSVDDDVDLAIGSMRHEASPVGRQ